MSSGLIVTALTLISVLTSLTVEAIKKILNDKHIDYSSNLLAMVVSIVLTLAICIGYVLYWGVPITIQNVVVMVALVFLSFLSATVGFDKVKQMLDQLGVIR